jgi:peptide/nickel transport system substrate-binding protein
MENRKRYKAYFLEVFGRKRPFQLITFGIVFLAQQFLVGCAPAPAMSTPVIAQPTATRAAPPQPSPTATAIQPSKGGKLQVIVPSDITPKTLVNAISPTNLWVLGGVYETLTRYRLDRLEAQPVLAESWQFSADSAKLTFKLRTGIKFHSGRSFTSADVKWNIERVADPKSASQLLNYGRMVTKVETPDDTTAILTFDKPPHPSSICSRIC